MNKTIVNRYGIMGQIDITIEECSELVRACIKYRRSMGFGYKTPLVQSETKAEIIKEIAHVSNAIESLKLLFGVSDEEIEKLVQESDTKCLKMLEDE